MSHTLWVISSPIPLLSVIGTDGSRPIRLPLGVFLQPITPFRRVVISLLNADVDMAGHIRERAP